MPKVLEVWGVPTGQKSDSVFLIYKKGTKEDSGITDLIAWESFLKLTFILASVQCVQTLITPLKARDTYVSFTAKTGVVASSREKPSTQENEPALLLCHRMHNQC